MPNLLKTILKPRILLNASRIAVVVGGILNIINQGPALLSGEDIPWSRVALNFIVPFCVASVSAAQNELDQRGDR